MGQDTLPRHTLTRADVARRLGISRSSVRRLEGGELHPELGADGIWRFDPAELRSSVTATRSVRPSARPAVQVTSGTTAAERGRLAARVFRLFERQWTLPQIVLATKQPPDVVRALYHEWLTSLEEGEWRREAEG
jgi:transcriptional regulator with XRE-family HTH domain